MTTGERVTDTDAGASRSAVLEWHLRQLSPEACRELIEDLWRARGFDVEATDRLVIATDGDRRTAIYAYPDDRFRRGRHPGRPVDVVVSPTGAPGAREFAAATDARLLDATGLRRMLTYALDRETTAALSRRHLGAPPSALEAPLRWRTRDRLASITAPTVPDRLAQAIVVFVLGGAVLAAVAVGGSAPSAVDAVRDDPGPGDATAAGTPSDTPAPFEGPVDAPGVTADGIVDLPALAAAHERALSNRSYSLWVDWYRSRPGTENRTQRDVDFAVNGSRYLLRSERRVNRIGYPIRTVYYDGTTAYIATFDEGDVRYRRETGTGVTGLSPYAFARTLVENWLATPTSRVTGRVVDGDEVFYRLVGAGPPSSIAGETVANYTIEAYVSPDGLVRSAAVEYTAYLTGRTVEIRFEWDYGRLGETTVDPPPYYSELAAANTTNATGNGTRSTG